MHPVNQTPSPRPLSPWEWLPRSLCCLAKPAWFPSSRWAHVASGHRLDVGMCRLLLHEARLRGRAAAVFGLLVTTLMVLVKVVPVVPGHFTRYEWIALGRLGSSGSFSPSTHQARGENRRRGYARRAGFR